MSKAITVLMSVFNSQAYLAEAVESVLAQSWPDFEFLIFDDGSSDDSWKILQSYSDPRIQLVKNEKNIGLSATLNRGLVMIESPYIVRMDADDIARPHRLKQQFEFMETHPEVDVCGTWARYFGRESRTWRPPEQDTAIRAKLLMDCPLAHPSVMIRTSLLRKHGLRYSEESRYCQDYRLWADCAPFGNFHNLPEVLLHYRLHEEQSGVTAKPEQQAVADQVRLSYLEKNLGMALSSEETQAYIMFLRAERGLDTIALERIQSLLERILCANKERSAFDSTYLQGELSRRWTRICRRSGVGRRRLWQLFASSSLYKNCGTWDRLQVGFRCFKNR
ncbi:glycosyltransferase family 2 protein [Planctomycetota bacterium]